MVLGVRTPVNNRDPIAIDDSADRVVRADTFLLAISGEALRTTAAITSADLNWFMRSPLLWVNLYYGFVWRLEIRS